VSKQFLVAQFETELLY